MEYNTYNDRKYVWTEFYPTENDLINALKKVDADKFEIMTNRYMVKGYEFIKSFVGAVNNGRELSPAQLRQLKRLAKQIKIYHENVEKIKNW